MIPTSRTPVTIEQQESAQRNSDKSTCFMLTHTKQPHDPTRPRPEPHEHSFCDDDLTSSSSSSDILPNIVFYRNSSKETRTTVATHTEQLTNSFDDANISKVLKSDDSIDRTSSTLWMVTVINSSTDDDTDLVFRVYPSKRSGVGPGQEYIGRNVLAPFLQLAEDPPTRSSLVFCINFKSEEEIFHFRRVEQVLEFLRFLLSDFESQKADAQRPTDEVDLFDESSSQISNISIDDIDIPRRRFRWLNRILGRSRSRQKIWD